MSGIVEKAVAGAGFKKSGRPKMGQRAPSKTGKDIVHVDRNRLREAGLLAPENVERQLADQYRRIKRPLLDNVFGRGAAPVDKGNLLVITSAMAGEGKTFSAMNLALSMMLEPDVNVVLVDCDVAKPQITSLLGLEQSVGLIDFLADDSVDIRDVLFPTDIDGLRVIPAGRQHAHATELLASNRMEHFIRELGTRYPDRVIVFDSPPLLLTSEAPVLVNLMGQVVMVVKAGVTSQSAVKQAVELVDTSRRPVSLILNMSRFKGTGNYGSYGYGS